MILLPYNEGALYLWRIAGKAKKWWKTGSRKKYSVENRKREVCHFHLGLIEVKGRSQRSKSKLQSTVNVIAHTSQLSCALCWVDAQGQDKLKVKIKDQNYPVGTKYCFNVALMLPGNIA